ncbi:hypothetical protein THRCLA_05812 [Thraustotheca clavata]|uniref:RGS domain-containing protein n=1 Tax=Thraustotheca clavata TaxID=74557 RepID=A0A1V9ZT00_9STRA|nr:hypothetical protein THRCLA_05812 [Thraustotheca clavata]
MGGVASVTSQQIPLIVAWICYLYMPFAVTLYLFYKRLPSLKHRMPMGTAISGAFATIYCLAQPLCSVYGSSIQCGTAMVILMIAFNSSAFVLVWTAFTVLVLYGITEIIAQPNRVPHNRAALWNTFRGMIIPTIQIPVGVAAGIMWNLPQIIILLLNNNYLTNFSYSECTQLPFVQIQVIITVCQAGIIVALFSFVAFQLRFTLDTFQLRRSYELTSFFMICCGICVGAYTITVNYVDSISSYYIPEILLTLSIQCIVFFNIVLPLIGAYHTRNNVHQHKGSASLQVNLDTYLQTEESYLSFFEYCGQGNALLVAWKACVDFQRGQCNLSIMEFYQQYMAQNGPKSVYNYIDEDTRRTYTKRVYLVKKKSSSRLLKTKIAPIPENVDVHFFQPLRRELINVMIQTKLPGYEQDELGKDWLIYQSRRRSIHSLEYVQKVATRSVLDINASEDSLEVIDPLESLILSSDAIQASTGFFPSVKDLQTCDSQKDKLLHFMSESQLQVNKTNAKLNEVSCPPLHNLLGPQTTSTGRLQPGQSGIISPSQSSKFLHHILLLCAIIYLRPLRHMLGIDSSVPIFNNEGNILGTLRVCLNPSTKPSILNENLGVQAKEIPTDIDDLSDTEIDDLQALEGSFVWLRLCVHIKEFNFPLMQYELSYSFGDSNIYHMPIEHDNNMKLLVTRELIEYVSNDAFILSLCSTCIDQMKSENNESSGHSVDAALIEQLSKEHTAMLQENEKEHQRNQSLLNELNRLVNQVQMQENELLKVAEKTQQGSSELAKAQEKARADARERETLQNQLKDADAKWHVLAEKSKVCHIQ